MSKDNNFTRAVKELLGEKENAENTSVKEAAAPSDSVASKPEAPSFTPTYTRTGAQSKEYTPPAPEFVPDFLAPQDLPQGETYINCDTIITGSIKAKTDVKNEGTVTGDIITEKNVCITGKVDGNVEGESAQVMGGYVIGNITVKRDVSNDFASIIIGDIVADNFSSDGKVKGNIKVENAVSLKSNAIVCGNVSSRKLSVQDGAVIKGNVQILTSKSTEDDVFDIPKSKMALDDTDALFEIPKIIPAANKAKAEEKIVEEEKKPAKTEEKEEKAEAKPVEDKKADEPKEEPSGFKMPSYNTAPSTSDLLGSLKQRMLEKDDKDSSKDGKDK